MVKLHSIEDKTCHSLGWFPLWLQIINDVYYVYNWHWTNQYIWLDIYPWETNSCHPVSHGKAPFKEECLFWLRIWKQTFKELFFFSCTKLKPILCWLEIQDITTAGNWNWLMSVNQWWLNVCLIDWMSRRLSIIMLKVLTQGWFVSVI